MDKICIAGFILCDLNEKFTISMFLFSTTPEGIVFTTKLNSVYRNVFGYQWSQFQLMTSFKMPSEILRNLRAGRVLTHWGRVAPVPICFDEPCVSIVSDNGIV